LLYDKAQNLLTETDAPIAPFYITTQQNLIKSYVIGLVPNPLDMVLFKNVSFKDDKGDN